MDSDLSASREVDQLCDEFEWHLRQNRLARIEDYLAQAKCATADVLFAELAAVEAEVRTEWGEPSPCAALQQRFPEYSQLLNELSNRVTLNERTAGTASGSSRASTTSEEAILPQQLGHFQLHEMIGEGAFGTVWRATDTILGRNVAIKVHRRRVETGDARGPIVDEARFAAGLRHPHIVAVHEVAEAEGVVFIVSSFIPGQNLRERLKAHVFSAQAAATLVRKVSLAVEHAHQQGIWHLDLKPANILLDEASEPHVTDFGLARRRTDSLEARDSLPWGTPLYMAPEQATGAVTTLDARTDVYALGVILYELLTGRPPFRGPLKDLLAAIIEEDPPPIRGTAPQVSVLLERICLRCLVKSPSGRYQSARDLARDLELFLTSALPVGVDPPVLERLRHWGRRWKRVGVFIGVAAAGVLPWVLSPPIPTTLAPRRVRFETRPAGCAITAVMLDPVSGEPDPQKITTLPGKTPLEAELALGDYLVVAVLDSQRFHEVYRQVPGAADQSRTLDPHERWSSHDANTAVLPLIRIPVELSLGDMVHAPDGVAIIGQGRWDVAGFFADPQELGPLVQTELRVEANRMRPTEDGRFVEAPYGVAVNVAERLGKRLPSLVELERLRQYSEARPSTGVRGINSDAWEWTTTKPGSETSPAVVRDAVETLRVLARLVANGPPLNPLDEGLSVRFTPTSAIADSSGIRLVRSARPRLTAADFIRQADEP